MEFLKTARNYLLDENLIECVEGLDRSEMMESEVSSQGREKNYIRNVVAESICTNEMYKKNENENENGCCIVGTDLLSDLEILTCYGGSERGSLIGHFTDEMDNESKEKEREEENKSLKTTLYGSQVLMKQILSQPISDTDKLRVRQQTIKDVHKKYQEASSLQHSFEVLRNNEKKMCWFYDAHKDISDNLHDMVYLNIWFLDWLNKSDTLLTTYNIYRIILSPLIGIMTPILYIIVPYIILRMKVGLPIPFATYVRMNLSMFLSSNSILPKSLDRFRKISVALTILFYFQSLFNNFELSKAIYRLTKMLVTKMNGLINFVHHAQKIVASLDGCTKFDSEMITDAFFLRFRPPSSRLSDFDRFFANKNKMKGIDGKSDTKDVMDVMGGIDGEQFSILSNFGKQLSFYKYIKLEEYKGILQRVYFYDNLLCAGKNVEPEGTRNTRSTGSTRSTGKMCLVEYCDLKYNVDSSETPVSPYLDIKGFYHPCMSNIPFDKIVKNDKCFGRIGVEEKQEEEKEEKDNERNMILTGPNAGGKSTIIKSIMISILLAQTLCIANAESLRLLPFKYINTQINIPDSKGKQSLFEAEMFRAKTNFDILAQLKPTDTSVIAMDEIFSSTNPVEGIAGAYAIAKKLGEKTNVINIISTHYIYLARLRQLREQINGKSKRIFCNCKMNVNMDAQDNVVEYPYKLAKGISRQFVALELLRKNGFDKDIIDEAVSIKNDFLEK